MATMTSKNGKLTLTKKNETKNTDKLVSRNGKLSLTKIKEKEVEDAPIASSTPVLPGKGSGFQFEAPNVKLNGVKDQGNLMSMNVTAAKDKRAEVDEQIEALQEERKSWQNQKDMWANSQFRGQKWDEAEREIKRIDQQIADLDKSTWSQDVLDEAAATQKAVEDYRAQKQRNEALLGMDIQATEEYLYRLEELEKLLPTYENEMDFWPEGSEKYNAAKAERDKIQAEIAQIESGYNWDDVQAAQKLQRKAELEKATQYLGFEKLSRYESTRNGETVYSASGYAGDSGWGDMQYDLINRNEEAVAQDRANAAVSGADLAGVDMSAYTFMTDEEIAIYNYYHRTDKALADEYLELLEPELTGRQMAKRLGMYEQYAKENPVAASAFSVITSPARGLSYVGQAADFLKTGEIDENAAYNILTRSGTQVRETVGQEIETALGDKWGKVGSFAYELGMSMGDFLMAAGISGGVSGVATAIMGTGAAAQTVVEAKQKGLSDARAFTLGTIAGAAEAITEKYSIEALLDKAKMGKSALTYILSNALTEGSEEAASGIINAFADVLLSRDKSEWAQAVESYKAMDYDEDHAWRMALTDQVMAIGLDAIGGAITGGLMGAGGAAINEAGYALSRPSGNAVTRQQVMDAIMQMAEEEGGKANVTESEGDDISDGGRGRIPGQSAGEQSGAVRQTGTADQRGRADDRRSRAAALNLPKVSGKEDGIARTTANKTYSYMPESAWDDEMRTVAENVYKKTGRRVQYIIGQIEIDKGNGRVGYARGVYTTDGRIIVQADNDRVGIAAIAAHEMFHANEFTEEELLQIKQRVIQGHNQESLERVLQNYWERLKATIGRDAQGNELTMEQAQKKLMDEVFADASALINEYEAAQYGNAVDAAAGQVLTDRQKAKQQVQQATEQTTGPPKQTRREARAERVRQEEAREQAEQDAKTEAKKGELQQVLEQMSEQLAAGNITEAEFDAIYDEIMSQPEMQGASFSMDAEEKKSVIADLRSYLNGNMSAEELNRKIGGRGAQRGTRAESSNLSTDAQKIKNAARRQRVSVEEYLHRNWELFDVDGEWNEAAREALDDERGVRFSEETMDIEAGSVYNEENDNEERDHNEQTEDRRSFYRRSIREARTVKESGDAAYAYRTVDWIHSSGSAETAGRELERLGIECFFHDGLEVNENGLTRKDHGVAAEIGGEVVGINSKAVADGVETAGHEAFHIWTIRNENEAYLQTLKNQIQYGNLETVKLGLEVSEAYFADANNIDPEYFAEEMMAKISGMIHSGKEEARLRKILKDYDAVKRAWEELVQKQMATADFSFTSQFADEPEYDEDAVFSEDDAMSIEEMEAQLQDLTSNNQTYSPLFYSQMEVVVDGMKQEKFGASSVVSMLRGRGVKAEEIKWSGIEQFLEGKKSVTKAELQEFIRNNQLQIEEETLDNKEISYTEEQEAKITEYTGKHRVIMDNLASEWERVVGSEFPFDRGANINSDDIERKLIQARNASVNEMAVGEDFLNATNALKAMIEANDNFGFDRMAQAYRSIVWNPENFIANFDVSAEDASVIREFAKMKRAVDEARAATTVSEQDSHKLKSLANQANALSRKIFDIKSEHYAEQAKRMTKWGQYKLDGGENYREYLFKMPGSEYSNQAMSGHWGSNNTGVLAHARVQDFTHNDEPVLFIEEIQSDWHNEGQKRGYQKDNSNVNYEVRTEKHKRNGEEIYRLYRDGEATEYFEYTEIPRSEEQILSLLKNYEAMDEQSKAPEAPYSKNYHEFVLKNMLRKAAEGGYSYLAWTPAEMQEERWSSDYAEGYRIEYDQDIPKFLNKYGKQWGAHTEDISLDGLRNVTVHAIPITEEMRESVLTKGQPMFSEETEPFYEVDRDTLNSKAKSYLQGAERSLERDIGKALDVPTMVQRNDLRGIVQRLSDSYLMTGEVNQDVMDALFEEAYKNGIKVDDEFYRENKDVKDYLRTTAIKITDGTENDFPEWDEYRQSCFGLLRISKSGQGVDQAYAEVQNMAPYLFPELLAQSDMLMKMREVAAGIRKVEKTLDEYYGPEAADFKKWARADFETAVNEHLSELNAVRRYVEERAQKDQELQMPQTTEEVMQLYTTMKEQRRSRDKARAKNLLTEADEMQLGRLHRGETTIENLPEGVNAKGIEAVYQAEREYEKTAKVIREYNRRRKAALKQEADEYLQTANSWKDKKTGLQYARETQERNIMDIVPDEALAKKIIERYFTPVHEAQAKATTMKNTMRDQVKKMNLSRKVEKGNLVSEAHAVQLLGEAEDNIRVLENSRGRMKVRDGKTLDEWKAVVANLWKENPKLNEQKIRSAVNQFRGIYDALFQQMNETRVRNGYEPINYRQGYFPHFQPNDTDGILAAFGKALGIDMQTAALPTSINGLTHTFKPNDTDGILAAFSKALPTSINGLTHTFKPGIQWFGNAQERLGFKTAYDAVEGFDKYIEGVADVIYQTDNIQALRALASQIRYRTTEDGIRQQVDQIMENPNLEEQDKKNRIEKIYESGKYTLSNFVVDLEEYTNLLANKKSRADRNMEQALGRGMYRLVKTLESRVAANMVAVNPGSWLTNFIPLTQGGAMLGKGNLMKGMWQTLKNYKAHDGFEARSAFLTNRRGSDPLVKTWAQAASGVASRPMEYIDTFVADSLVRARTMQNMQAGMSEEAAIREADNWAAGVMADRSKGSMPTLFNRSNPLTKIFTQFQLEVNNQFSYLFKDLPRETRKKGVLALTAALLKFFIGAWLYDEIYEYFIGRRPALDPIGMLNDTIGDLTGYEMPNLLEAAGDVIRGDEVDFTTEKLNRYKAVENLFVAAAEELPFIGGILGGGRVPIQSALPDFQNLGKVVFNEDWSTEKKWATAAKELMNPATYLLLPFGGGQIKKVLQGAKALAEGGRYTVDADGNERLQYPVYSDEWMTATVFGPTATTTGREWIENDFPTLGKTETAAYLALRANGVENEEAYSVIRDIRAAEKTEDMSEAEHERQVLRESDLDENDKGLVYYEMLASEKEAELIDLLTEDTDEIGKIYTMLDGIRLAEDSNGKREAIMESGLADLEKRQAYQYMLGTKQEDGSYLSSREDDMDAFWAAGLGMDDFLQAQNEYTRINEEYAGAGDKAVEFSRWLNGTGWTESQKQTAKNAFKYYSQIPQTQTRYDKLISAGLNEDTAYGLNNVLSDLQPEEGKDSVSARQKYKAIADQRLSEEDAMKAYSAVMSESEYKKLTAANELALDPNMYAEVKYLMTEYDENGNGSYSNAEIEAAIKAYAKENRKVDNGDKALLWQMLTGSKTTKNNPFSKTLAGRYLDLLG